MTTQSTILKDATPANTITLDNTDGVFSVKKGEPGVTIFKAPTGEAPAFSAYQSTSQSLTINDYTKLTIDVENFDTAGAFSASRFTAPVAGYYQISGAYAANVSTSPQLYIYKNGVSTLRIAVAVTNQTAVAGSGLVYLGAGDYVELYAYQSGVAQTTIAGALYTWFQGVLVRAA